MKTICVEVSLSEFEDHEIVSEFEHRDLVTTQHEEALKMLREQHRLDLIALYVGFERIDTELVRFHDPRRAAEILHSEMDHLVREAGIA